MFLSEMNFLHKNKENPFTPGAEDVDAACPDHSSKCLCIETSHNFLLANMKAC